MTKSDLTSHHQNDLQPSLEKVYEILDRANDIASKTGLEELLDQMLDLVTDVCGSDIGTLYLLDEKTNELVFKVVKGDKTSQQLQGIRIKGDTGIVGATLQSLRPLIIPDLPNDERWAAFSQPNLRNVISLPLLVQDRPIGIVQIFNYSHYELNLIRFLCNRLASEVEKLQLITATNERNQRLQALIEIIRSIITAQDQKQILQGILYKAQELLDAEAASLFMIDEEKGDLVLLLSTNLTEEETKKIRVPIGQGIIGKTVAENRTVYFPEEQQQVSVYANADKVSGHETRSLISVPLRGLEFSKGGLDGQAKERIIGGLQGFNKKRGSFTKEDGELLNIFSTLATTFYTIRQTNQQLNELFLQFIKVIAGSIDAKDPYTRKHSQYVSAFSVAIAKELGLDDETVYLIEVGGILHDIGKIGIPDSVLNKPGRLTDEEYDIIKQHPNIGYNILKEVNMLREELPALAEHHEKLDGTGYPNGLTGKQISLMGRIIAVADVFDALTSDRPYREAWTAEVAFDFLEKGKNSHFDPACVDAIIAAYNKGGIHTQKEDELLTKKNAS